MTSSQRARLLAADALSRRGAPIPEVLFEDFTRYVDAKTRPYLFAVIVIGAIGYTMFALGDYVAMRDVLWDSLLLRSVFLASVMALTKWLVSSGRSIYLLETVGALYVHLASVIWFYLLFTSASDAVGVYAFSSVIFILWLNLGFTARFSASVISTATLTLLLMAGVIWVNQGDWVTVFIYGCLHASILVFSVVVSWYNCFNQRRLFLHGIIDESKNAELQQANQLLWSQAHSDPLTGLPNRPLLEDRLNQALAAAEREGRKLALLFVDLDRFKPVNDSYGHAVGDQVLQTVAARMSGIVRGADTIARVGGDEFVVVLTGVRQSEEAIGKAEELIVKVGEPLTVTNHEIAIGCSVGIALFPDHGDSAETLQQNADEAVYRAKADGRNCARVYHAG